MLLPVHPKNMALNFMKKIFDEGPGELLHDVAEAFVKVVTGEWMKASKLVKNASPGDLIEINRGLYSHWAMYWKDGLIINVPAESKEDHEVTVKIESLSDVAGNHWVRINNHEELALVLGFSKRSRAAAVESAVHYVGKTVPYSFLKKNCEYYATKWLYGSGFSTQVAEVLARRPILVAQIGIQMSADALDELTS